DQLGALELQLMRVSCEYSVHERAGQPADAGRNRDEKPRPADEHATQQVIPELAEPALAPAVAMMFGVLAAQQDAGVHQAMHHVFHEGSEYKSADKSQESYQELLVWHRLASCVLLWLHWNRDRNVSTSTIPVQ